MILDFARESWASISQSALPLMAEHWDEMQYGYALNVNLEMVAALEGAGLMRIYTARSKAGGLIGYAGFSVNRSVQNKDMIEARDMGVYLIRDYRGGGVGKLLLDYADKSLTEEGVDIIFYASPPSQTKFVSLLEGRGFKKVDEVFARRVSCQQG